MLTGDKVETATSIAISSGMRRPTNRFYFMRDVTEVKRVEEHLREFRNLSHNHVLIIDGKTLDTILSEPQVESYFFE